jgi:hypothetical protein
VAGPYDRSEGSHFAFEAADNKATVGFYRVELSLHVPLCDDATSSQQNVQIPAALFACSYPDSIPWLTKMNVVPLSISKGSWGWWESTATR